MKHFKNHAISRFLLATLLLTLTSGCGGSGGGGHDDGGSDTPPPAPTQAPDIIIDGHQVTATWTAEPDSEYYVVYGLDPEDTQESTWGLDNTSPLNFSIHNEGMYYFRLVKVVNGLHSEPGLAYDQAPVLAKPNLVLRQANVDSNRLELMNRDANASETVLYYGTSSEVNPDNWTTVGTFPNDMDSELTHTITEFVDDDYAPLTYRYVARSAYEDKSVSEVSETIETTADLVRFKIYEVSDPSDSTDYGPEIQDAAQYARADGGLFDVVGDTVYWLCPTQYGNHGGFCRAPVVPEESPAAPELIDIAGVLDREPWAFTVEPNPDGDLVIYFLRKDDYYKVQPWRYRSNASEDLRQLATLPNEEEAVAILQDVDHLYVTTETSIYQIAKTSIEDPTPDMTALVTERSNLRAPVVAGGRLYFADETGLYSLDIPGGTTPAAVVALAADLLPVTSIAAVDGTIYFIANDDTDGVNSGQALYKWTSGIMTNIQNRLYNAGHLAHHDGNLLWLDNSKIYSVPADGGTVTGRVSPAALGFAVADTDRDLVFAMRDAAPSYVYSIPPEYRFGAPAAPPAPTSLELTPRDSQIELAASGSDKAEALEVYVETDETKRYVGLNRSNVSCLMNGTTATVSVVPVNISGPGASLSKSATPVISWENDQDTIGTDSDDGKIFLGGELRARAGLCSRSVTFHIHRGTSPNVDTSGDPVASVDSGEEATYNRFTWEDTSPTNDGTRYYYNIRVEDKTFEGAEVVNPTLSEPCFEAGMEIYSNAAAPVERLISDDPLRWVSGHRYRMTRLNGSFYYTTYYQHGFPTDQGFLFAGESPEAFEALNGYSLLTSDGTNLYAVYPGATANYGLYKVSDIGGSPIFEKLTDITDQSEYYEPTSLLISGGYLYLSTKKGIVIKVDASGGEADVLVHDHGFSSYYPDNLTEANGKIYWTRANEIWAVAAGGGSAEKVYETSLGGSTPDLAVNATHYYWKHPESWGGYYRAPIGITSGADDFFNDGQGMAVDPATGDLYWENHGDIFTLDTEGRHLAVCSRAPNEAAGSLKFLEDGLLYSFGNGVLDRCVP